MFSFSMSALQLIIFFIPPPPYASEFSIKGPLFLINRNGLLYFLVANLATGFVNIGLNLLGKPYSFTHMHEILILSTYLLLITSFIVYINKKYKKKE